LPRYEAQKLGTPPTNGSRADERSLHELQLRAWAIPAGRVRGLRLTPLPGRKFRSFNDVPRFAESRWGHYPHRGSGCCASRWFPVRTTSTSRSLPGGRVASHGEGVNATAGQCLERLVVPRARFGCVSHQAGDQVE